MIRRAAASCLCEAIGQKIGYSNTRTLNVAATQDGGLYRTAEFGFRGAFVTRVC